jgi:hypothetical protein
VAIRVVKDQCINASLIATQLALATHEVHCLLLEFSASFGDIVLAFALGTAEAALSTRQDVITSMPVTPFRYSRSLYH